MVTLVIMPCVRHLDCHDFVKRGNVELDWSLRDAEDIEPPWQQIFFHNRQIPPTRLRKFCTPLKSLMTVQDSARGKTDMQEYLRMFKAASTLAMRGFVHRLADVEGESSLTLVAQRD